MKYPLVSIIVVNFNGGDVLLDCIQTLIKIDYPSWELILVDNGSTDGSQKITSKILSKVPHFELIQNTKNVGFALANNQGFKKSKGEYILLLNNDTKVIPKFLSVMVEKMIREKKVGVMQPKIYMMDKEEYLDNAGSFLNSVGFSQHWGYGEKDRSEFAQTREIFSAKGACLLTRRSLVDSIGLFDSNFNSYFEESDFCWRAWLSGWKVIYYPKTFIYHKVGFTSKRMSQIDVNYYSLRNRLASFYKNFELFNMLKYTFIHLCLLLALGSYYLLHLQFAKAWMVFKSIGVFFLSLVSLTKKRIDVQKLRKVSDKKILPIIMHKADIFQMLNHFKKVEANFK